MTSSAKFIASILNGIFINIIFYNIILRYYRLSISKLHYLMSKNIQTTC